MQTELSWPLERASTTATVEPSTRCDCRRAWSSSSSPAIAVIVVTRDVREAVVDQPCRDVATTTPISKITNAKSRIAIDVRVESRGARPTSLRTISTSAKPAAIANVTWRSGDGGVGSNQIHRAIATDASSCQYARAIDGRDAFLSWGSLIGRGYPRERDPEECESPIHRGERTVDVAPIEQVSARSSTEIHATTSSDSIATSTRDRSRSTCRRRHPSSRRLRRSDTRDRRRRASGQNDSHERLAVRRAPLAGAGVSPDPAFWYEGS